MRKLALVVVVLLVVLSLGCSRHTTGIPVYIHDTVTAVKIVHDSVSVDKWHTLFINGDTVRVTDSVTVDRWHTSHDTVRKVTEVPVEVPVVKEVEKPLTWWQQTKQGGFWVLLVLVVGFFARKFRRR